MGGVGHIEIMDVDVAVEEEFDEPILFNVSRLEILSLERSIRLAAEEYHQAIQQGNRKLYRRKFHSNFEYLWNAAIKIISREENYGKTCIRLMGMIAYFRSDRITHKMLKSLSDAEGAANIHEMVLDILLTLEKYGLIRLEFRGDHHNFNSVVTNNRLLSAVIRKKNEHIEVDLLRSCLKMFKNSVELMELGELKCFKPLWTYSLKHDELVFEFKDLGLTYYDKVHVPKMLEKFRKLFGEFDDNTLELRYRELQFLLREDSKTNCRTVLKKCLESRRVFEEYTNETGDLFHRLQDIGKQIYDAGLRLCKKNKKWNSKFFLESSKFYELQDNFNKEQLDFADDIEHFGQTVKPLLELTRTSQIFSMLVRLRVKFIEKKIDASEELLARPAYAKRKGFLSKLTEIVISLISHPGNGSMKTRKSLQFKSAVLGELLTILDSQFKYLLDNLKKDCTLDNVGCLPEIAMNLIKCLAELRNYGEILTVLQETDSIWKESMDLVCSRVRYKEYEENFQKKFARRLQDLHGYFGIHDLIYDYNTRKNIPLALKEKLFNETLITTKKFAAFCHRLDKTTEFVYDVDKKVFIEDKNSHVLFHIVNCLLKLGRVTEFINFTKEYEKWITKKWSNPIHRAHKIIDFAELVTKSVLAGATDPNEWVPLLKTIILMTKKYTEIHAKEYDEMCNKYFEKVELNEIQHSELQFNQT